MNAPLCLIDFIICLMLIALSINITPMHAAFSRYTKVDGFPALSPKLLIMKLSLSVDAILSIVHNITR
jgi:hypothetical protein